MQREAIHGGAQRLVVREQRAEASASRSSPRRWRGTRIIVESTHSAHRALVALIDREDVDLTVMATHGRDGLAHLLLGSVTEKVVQRGRCSVLCIREPEHGVHLPYQQVLLPTDLSEASARPYPLIERLARKFQTRVMTLHVSEDDPPPPRQRVAEAMAGHMEGLEVHHRVVTGRDWEQIVSVAKRAKIDLIVMSTAGRHGLGESILGSTTERVVRHAPAPCWSHGGRSKGPTEGGRADRRLA